MQITQPQRHWFSITLGLIAAIAVGCAQTDKVTPAKETGEVNVYTSRHYDTDDQLYQLFTEETGIKINLIEGKDNELIERIKSEGQNSPADVLITVDVGRLWRAQQEGILQPIQSSILEEKIPSNLRSPEGYWFGLSKRARIIVYNVDKVKPEELSTYEALAEPKWRGRICVRSSSNIYNQSLVAAKIEEIGAEATLAWLKGLVQNFARQPEGNDTAQIKAVASGVCDVALVNHYYVARLKQSKDPQTQEIAAKVAVFFPNPTHINISGIGVTTNAPNKEQAIKFVEFLVTPEAQEIFANANNEYPVVKGIEPNETLKSFGEFKESSLNVAAYGKRNAEAVKLMDQAGWK
ncbi:MAG: Fe(3+) ABC transporter substrate-binding protein [Cyanobacteria bacterium J083]|nr:MAG: Fe(3+) ABC transporter substrate-binding protein [Cyanobacteria bacterium J083]